MSNKQNDEVCGMKTMTENGEFKKRIKNLVDDMLESESDNGTRSLDSESFFLIIDEAKKEFDAQKWYFQDVMKDAMPEILKWFLKWFGES